jgi:outer membrane protein TolC
MTATLLLLAGCVGPGYQPKPMPTPKAWTFRDAAVMRADAAPDAQWWASFDDPILDALIRDAAAANHDIRIAAERVRGSRAQRGITLRADSAGRRERDARPGSRAATRIPRSRHDAQLYRRDSTRVELDLWGGIRRDLEAAIAPRRSR